MKEKQAEVEKLNSLGHTTEIPPENTMLVEITSYDIV